MGLNKKQRERLLKQHCGVINEDDAIDPRHYFYNKRKPNRKYRKAFQLCRQVLETLHLVLTDDDPGLEGLNVVDVVPAPDSRRMLVLLSLDPAMKVTSANQIEEVMDCLQSHVPRLRSEIARTINRKKTPNLVFEITKFKPDSKPESP